MQDNMENAVNLKLEKAGKFVYKVFTSTNVELGTFELDINGFYYFYNKEWNKGSWSSYSLRLISDKLDEINKPYSETVDDQAQRDFEQRARVEYRKLLNESGMFFEFYPQLTGEWGKDKEQWLVEYRKLEDLRALNNTF